jgi:ribonuclease HI
VTHPSRLVAHIDGGSRGNPGPAAYGALIESAEGSPVASLSEFLGRATNNCAEYQGLLAVLRYALDHGYSALEVVSDSELLVRQIQGSYKVKSPDLRPLYEEARRIIAQLRSFRIRHVLRDENREADRLANEAMDAGMCSSPKAASARSRQPTPDLLHATASFSGGQLKLDRDLPLREGELVDVEIRRRK